MKSVMYKTKIILLHFDGNNSEKFALNISKN